MALSPLAIDMIRRAAKMLKDIEQYKPFLDELTIVYDAEGGLKTTIQQSDLDNLVLPQFGGSTPTLSGLTKAQLDDAMYFCTAVFKPALVNNVTQIAALAVRSPQLPG